MRTEIEICSQITVHEVSMFVIRVLHHVALHSVYAYSCTESIAPMARAQRQPGRGRGNTCTSINTYLYIYIYICIIASTGSGAGQKHGSATAQIPRVVP